MRKCKKYTDEQIKWIIEMINNKSFKNMKNMVESFNKTFNETRTISGIQTKVNDLGLKISNGFTKEEEEWLINNHRKYSQNELHSKFISIFPYRSKNSLTQFMSRKGYNQKLYSDQEKEWILNNYYLYDSLENLLMEFNKTFDRKRTLKGFSLYCQTKLNLKRFIPYTEQENEWLISNIDLYSYDELAKEFNNTFNKNVTKAGIETYCNRKLNIKKENPRKFTSVPCPVGHQVIINGRTLIRTKEIDSQDSRKNRGAKTYEPLSRVVWKNHYKKDIPEDCQIIFLDGDKTNFDISNLYCIKKKYLPYMIHNKWFSDNPEVTLTAIKWCELMYSI